MKGYIYISGTGTDSLAGTYLNDPIFDSPPTLGACMPNVRRLVVPGDRIYVVSGSVENVQQYVVGGLEVVEKINALAAYERFPQYRLHVDDLGNKTGNIIVDVDGRQHELDDHDGRDREKFVKRLENYIVGRNPLTLATPREVELSRERTLRILEKLFDKRGNRAVDVMGRWRKLEGEQIASLEAWIEDIKRTAGSE